MSIVLVSLLCLADPVPAAPDVAPPTALERMDAWIGRWKVEGAYLRDGQEVAKVTGTWSIDRVLRGNVVRMQYASLVDGKPADYLGFYSWRPVQRDFSSVWIQSEDPTRWEELGTFDGGGSLVMEGVIGVAPADGATNYRSVYRLVDAEHLLVEDSRRSSADAPWTPFWRVTLTRVEAEDDADGKPAAADPEPAPLRGTSLFAMRSGDGARQPDAR